MIIALTVLTVVGLSLYTLGFLSLAVLWVLAKDMAYGLPRIMFGAGMAAFLNISLIYVLTLTFALYPELRDHNDIRVALAAFITVLPAYLPIRLAAWWVRLPAPEKERIRKEVAADA